MTAEHVSRRQTADRGSLSARDRVLVLAVHPDDESLCAGGLIQHALARGARVRVVFITDGDNNPWPQRFVERRWRIGPADRARWGKRRRGEALAAIGCLGLSPEDADFWGFPDLGITEILMAGGRDLLPRLSDTIRDWRPSVILGPSRYDQHPDHNSVALMLDMALRNALPASHERVVWEYLVHNRMSGTAAGGMQLKLSPEQMSRKRQAILCHRTQMALCRRRFLKFAGPAEIFLPPGERAKGRLGSPLVRAELFDESLVLTMGRVRRPATILISAESDDGAVGREIRISPGGEVVFGEGISREIMAGASILNGTTIILPAGPFASATALAFKFKGGWGIFDRSGWQLLPLVSRRSRAGEGDFLAAPRTCCIIPCYNIAGVCGAVVREAAGFADMVIAVNDGSTDETEKVLREAAAEYPGRVQVLSFARNRGKGVVLIDAFRHVLGTQAFDVLVTLDGDGQHRPEDISRLARETCRGRYPLVIGERLERSRMPLRSRLGNTLTALVMRAFYPGAPTDTQSGLRAFRPEFVREIVERIEGGRYETELKMLLLALTRGYRIGSVTIPTVYLCGNRLSHFRPLADSWRIYRTLLAWQWDGDAGSRQGTPQIGETVG